MSNFFNNHQTILKMKKVSLAIGLFFIVFGLNSCSKVTSPSTFEFDVATSSFNWTNLNTFGGSNYAYVYTHNISAITSDVIDNGSVLGYVDVGGEWAAMPFTVTYISNIVQFNYQYSSGLVKILGKVDTGSLPNTTISFKIVVLTPKHMELMDGVDTNNYSEVAETLNIQ